MNRHQTVVHDGCEKLRTAAELYADAIGAKIVRVTMGLHVFNVLAYINSLNGPALETHDPTQIPEDVTYKGVPITIIRDGRTGEPIHHESMPVYEFEAKG